MEGIEKAFGAGSVMRLGSETVQAIEVIPSGSIALDHCLGIGGYPRGRVVELYGPPSSGKSTLALHAIANVQKAGGTACVLDTEYALDPIYAANVGVNLDDLIVSQPDTGEQAWEIAESLIRSGGVDLLVVDSIAAMVPFAEMQGDFGNSNVGLHARLVSQAMRKLTGPLGKTNTTALLINQLRSLIQPFGPSETTTGGRAIPFYASVRIDVRRSETLKDGQDAVANRTKAKIVKNKCAPPLKVCEFDIVYGEGISRYAELVDLGISQGLISKGGAWLTYGGERFHGRAKAIEWLKSMPATAEVLEESIRGML